MYSIPEVVIIEDEPESLNLLQSLLNESGLVKITGTLTDPFRAADLINSLKPDMLFLDIKMPGKSGFEVLDDLHKKGVDSPFVVFTTAYDEYAIKAFDYAAFDYLLKPVEPGRLRDTIIRFIERGKTFESQKIPLLIESYKKLLFRNISGFIIIDPAEIVCIIADGNYSVFHLEGDKCEIVTSLLHKIEEQLPGRKFFRTSRSAIINTGYLKKINTKQLQCILNKNGSEFRVEISRDRINDLIEIMKNQ
jgi:two-component system LytT family response regulator